MVRAEGNSGGQHNGVMTKYLGREINVWELGREGGRPWRGEELERYGVGDGRTREGRGQKGEDS